jgi:hypothetical protein
LQKINFSKTFKKIGHFFVQKNKYLYFKIFEKKIKNQSEKEETEKRKSTKGKTKSKKSKNQKKKTKTVRIQKENPR